MKATSVFNVIRGANSSHFKPDMTVGSIMDIDPFVLKDEMEIEYVLIDIDQTIVSQGADDPPEDILNKLYQFVDAFSATNIRFLTNEHIPARIDKLRELTDIDVVSGDFRKPDEKAYRAALTKMDAEPSKKIAMIGDRLWTDVLGANKLGIFTILTRPLAPSTDSLGVYCARFFERLQLNSSTFKIIFVLFASLSLLGVSLKSIFFMTISVAREGFKLDQSAFTDAKTSIIIMVIISATLWYIFAVNRARKAPASRDAILGLFDTYPLAFRAAFGMFIFFWAAFIDNDAGEVPQLFDIAVPVVFITHIYLYMSFFRQYHTDTGRVLRILADMGLIAFTAYNMDGLYKPAVLLLLLLPIGTAARYLRRLHTAVVIGISIAIAIAILSNSGLVLTSEMSTAQTRLLTTILSIVFLVSGVSLVIETRETNRPIDRLTGRFFELREDDSAEIETYFSHAAGVLNCSRVMLVDRERGGLCFDLLVPLNEGLTKINIEYSGRLIRRIISRKESLELLRDGKENDSRSRTVTLKQHISAFRIMEVEMRPPIDGGINSIIVMRVPSMKGCYFLAINGFTRSRATQASFSVRHIPIMKLLVLGLSTSYKPILNMKANFSAQIDTKDS